ncbi:MAG: hypothetical protein JOZ75_12910 [Candidatus Dormibacteraeota bacterium]|nr:hypothetical protein [Candidatus Dormibacteraeota bacterium]
MLGGLGALLSACGGGLAPGQTLPPDPSLPVPTPIANPANGNAPPARIGPAVGFDPISRSLIMFGGAPATGTNLATGHPASRLDDTWAWDGQKWTQLQPKTTPPALFGARMITDPDTQQLLLVSGAGDVSGTALQQEGMWEWDGSTWSRVSDNPVQVPFPAAATDPVRNQAVISGFDPAYPSACAVTCIPPPQYDQGGDYVFTKGDSGWNTASGYAPGWARAATAYDPVSQRIISTAGSKQNGVQWTYAWDRKAWSQIIRSSTTTASPDPNQPLGPCDASTDEHAQRIVMACASATGPTGGVTWTFDGKAWQPVSGADTPAIPADPSITGRAGVLTLAYDPAIPAVVMLIGGASGSEAMAAWNGSSWSQVS